MKAIAKENKMNWKTGTAEEFLDDCEECEGKCKEFKTCSKCGGDMTYGVTVVHSGKFSADSVDSRWKCQDCGYCEVE